MTTVDIRPELDAIVVLVNLDSFTVGERGGDRDRVRVTVASALPIEVSVGCAAVTVSFSSFRLISGTTSVVVGGSVFGVMKGVGGIGGKGGLTAPLDRIFVT